jgi:type IV pilus assembly protein PilQ
MRDTSGGPIPRETPRLEALAAPEPEPANRFAPKTIGGGSSTTAASTGRPIDLDVRGASVADVCRLLADVGHVSIVVADDVRGTVTVKLHHVPWESALTAILEAKGLASVRRDDVIVVTSRP